jgi:hypothetical protein
MRHISTQQERERKVITASKNNPTNETSSQTSGTTSTIVPHQHLSSPAVPQSPSAGSFTESGTCSSQGSKDSSSVYRVGDEMAVADPRDDEAGKSDMKHLRGGEDEDGGTDPDVDKKKIKEPSTRTADGVNDDNPSDKGTSYLFFFSFLKKENASPTFTIQHSIIFITGISPHILTRVLLVYHKSCV